MTARFTDVFIRNLKPTPQRYDLREVDGFGIRVFPSGEKSWFYFYTFLGRKRRMTLGKYPAMGLKEARAAHTRAKQLLTQGLDPAEARKTDRQAQARALLEAQRNPTVSTLVREYLEYWAKPRKRSWREDERILNKDVIPVWGKRQARDIQRRDVVLLLDAIKDRGAPIQANRTLAVIRRLFNFSVERGVLETTPASHIKPPGKETPGERTLTAEEIGRFWHGLEAAPMSAPVRSALRLILVTGQRPGEIAGMAWPEIIGDWWTIPGFRTKNGESHRVPLSGLASALLAELEALRTSDWVFPSPHTDKDQAIGATALDHALRRCAFDDLAPFTPHDLRRTVGTRLGELGFNRLIQDKVLNHKDNSVGGIYDRHSYDKEKRLALEAWANHLQAILSGEALPTNVMPMKRTN